MLSKLMLASAVLLAVPAGAQVSLGFAGAAGVSIPVGDFANRVNTGYNVAGALVVSPAVLPISGRLEVGFNQYSDAIVTGTTNVVSATANGILTLPTMPFYVLAGVGYYGTSQPDPIVARTNRRSDFGVNGGVGIRMKLTGFTASLEARVHSVPNASLTYIPITFGVTF